MKLFELNDQEGQRPKVGTANSLNRWNKERDKYDTTRPEWDGIDTGPDKEPKYDPTPEKDYDEEGNERTVRDMRDNPKFMAWFGKSKCVDKFGRPLAMFHGSSAGMERTAYKYKEVNTNGFIHHEAEPYEHPGGDVISSFDNDEGREVGNRGVSKSKAYFFTPMPGYADSYGQVLYPVYLKVLNPAVMQTYKEMAQMDEQKVRMLKMMGFDGAVEPSGTEWCVFDPTQVKSATGNNGNYDPNSKHIGEGKDCP